MYIVENLAPHDFQWAIEVAAKNMISKEVGRPELYNRDQFIKLTNVMRQTNTVLIAKKNGRPVGVIGGIITPNLYNPKYTTLAEMLWYVLPEHRGGRAGIMLLKEFKERGMDQADEITLSTLTTSAVNPPSLTKLGWTHKENAYSLMTNRS